MPWFPCLSPLDKTVATLDWLVRQMAGDLDSRGEITREDYRAVLEGIARLADDLRPLQDLPVREGRAAD